MRIYLLVVALLIVGASNGAELASFNDWAARLNNGLARATSSAGSPTAIDEVLKEALNGAPANLADQNPADATLRSHLLMDAVEKHLAPSHPIRLAALERKIRVDLNLKRSDAAAETLLKVVADIASGQSRVSPDLMALVLEDQIVYLMLAGHFDDVSFGVEDLLQKLDPEPIEIRVLVQRLYVQLGAAYRELGVRDPDLLARSELVLKHSRDLAEALHGTDSLQFAAVAENLARLRLDQHETEKADHWATKAHAVRSARLNPKHPDLAVSRKTLARVRIDQRKFDDASNLLEGTLPIFDGSFGPTSEDTIECLQLLTLVEMWRGRDKEAEILANRLLLRQRLRAFGKVTIRSEGDRQAVVRRMMPLLVPGMLGPNAPNLLARSLASFKDIVPRSLLETREIVRALSNSTAQPLVNQWHSLQDSFVMSLTNGVVDDYQKMPLELVRRFEKLESQLASMGFDVGGVRRSLFPTNSDLELPSNTALVDYFLHGDVTNPTNVVMRCDALVHIAGQPPQMVGLPDSADLPLAVASYSKAMTGNEIPEQEALKLLVRLRELVWDSIEARLPVGVTNIYISPEGPMNFISWASFVKDDRLLGERFCFRYVTSVGDLRKDKLKLPAKPNLKAFVDPDFDWAVTNRHEEEFVTRLPNTLQEGNAIAAVAKKRKWDVELFSAERVTKVNLQAVQSPWMLLIGTHGFSYPSVSPYVANDYDPETFTRPMKSSGIVLAGANGRVPPTFLEEGNPQPQRMFGGFALVPFLTSTTWVPNPDGFLTALEASNLNLRGTWLVVLSACDSGRGEFGLSQGVFGMPRAILCAGARNLLATLWPVDDRLTAELMAKFAEEAMESGDPAGALAKVQGQALQRWRTSYGIVGAARRGAPYIVLTREL